MRSLIEPFLKRKVEHFDIYFFENTPVWLMPERGGRTVSLELLRAKHPDHRLIVFATGRDWFVHPNMTPLPAVETLKLWSRRAFLTPTPIRNWGVTEPSVARTLNTPVARATRTGFSGLAHMLGLARPRSNLLPDRDVEQAQFDVDAPLDLRLRPHTMVFNTPPDEMSAEEVVDSLKGYLDSDGFKWISALAVYPGLEWDLTIYLGTQDKFRQQALFKDDEDSDRRLAMLMQLPWLQAGRMPNWLRNELIGQNDKHGKGCRIRRSHQTVRKWSARMTALPIPAFCCELGRDLPYDREGKRNTRRCHSSGFPAQR